MLHPNAEHRCIVLKKNKLMKIHGADKVRPFDELFAETFSKGFLDESQFDLVDKVGNVFNRLIIWDGRMIHAASAYFGNNKEDSRLFQLFFFDLEP